MSDSREWMYRRYENGILTPQFLAGLETFIEFATSQKTFMDRDKIKCPCRKCDNEPYIDTDEVRYHISRSHRGGSKSIEILAQEMAAKEGIPLEKCIYSSFRAIHMNKDGTYMSKKAEKIDTKVKRIVAERGEGADVNDIYMEVNQEDLRKKQRMYGTGNLAASLLHNKSTSTSQFHASQQCDNRFVEMEKQLQEEREQRQRLEEEVRATKEMMKQFMSQHQSRTSSDDRRDSPE